MMIMTHEHPKYAVHLICIEMYMHVYVRIMLVFAGIGMYYNNLSEKMAKYESTYWSVFACMTMYCHVFDLYLYVSACIQTIMY